MLSCHCTVQFNHSFCRFTKSCPYYWVLYSVGMPGVDGLSTEQRKRLTIAVELVANPSVVFMDEPTSGLDARAAAIVMKAVRNVANNGRTVIVTIHQPSIEIFESFDLLVLMQKGGRLTYFGPLGHESSELIKYLEAVPGVPPIPAGKVGDLKNVGFLKHEVCLVVCSRVHSQCLG